MCLAGSNKVSHVESELTISVFKTLFCENCIPNFHVRAQGGIMVKKRVKSSL